MPAKKNRTGNQTPTQSFVLPYRKSHWKEAVELYEKTGRKVLPWQKNLLRDILAIGRGDLWKHQKFGFSVPRRNGKSEIIAIRELWGLEHGERICHTAHRADTSRIGWQNLCRLLTDAGYEELGRKKKKRKTNPIRRTVSAPISKTGERKSRSSGRAEKSASGRAHATADLGRALTSLLSTRRRSTQTIRKPR